MKPYLSIIISFRNDNYYLSNAIERFNFALNTLVNQLNDAKIDSEIILVDWNSPNPEKPLIASLMNVCLCFAIIFLIVAVLYYKLAMPTNTENGEE